MIDLSAPQQRATRKRAWRWASLLLRLAGSALVLTSPSVVRAEEPEDEAAPASARGWLDFRPTALDLEFDAEFERRRVGVSGAPRRDTSQRNEDQRYREAMSLRFEGDVVDPKFISFDGGIKLGLSQERFKESIDWYDQTDTDSGLLLEYDLSLRVLPEKPFSGGAYARRVRDRVPRRFLTSLLEEREEAGLSATYHAERWTTDIRFDWSDVERSGNSAARDDEELRTAKLSVDNRWEISEDHSLRIAYDHSREESKYGGSPYEYDTRRDQFRLEHSLAFGPSRRNTLDTILRWNNEQGDLARDELEFTPKLRLRHTDRFETAYRYSFDRVEQDQIETNRHKFDWEAIFRPTDGLRLTTDLFWLREHIEDDVESNQGGGIFDGNYRRSTGYGEFRANLGFSADQLRTLGDGEDGVVRGELHALDPSRPTYLQRADVERWTVRAYNATRTRLFIEGRDYWMVQTGRRTIVYRLLSGVIADGEAVSFDYSYRVPTGSRVNSYRTDVLLEHELPFHLTPYYAFEIRRQDADGALGAPAYEDNTERHRAGVRYARNDWSVSGEFESFDDSVEPYEAWHVHGQATLLSEVNYSMETAAHASRYHFDGGFDPRRVWVVDLDLTNRFRIDAYWSATLGTAYRWEDNTSIGETNGVDLQWGVHFERGRLGVDLTAEYDLLSLDTSREEGYGVFLNIRRDLSHLLDTWRTVR